MKINMKTIEECKGILKNCEWNATPRPKNGGRRWGMRRSTLLDRKTEQEAWNAWLEYCQQHGKV
jgi:hypothetical protein